MAFINHNKKALFIHNPKCGGVYVRENLLQNYGFIPFGDDLHHKYADFFDDPKHIKMDEDTDSHTIRTQGIYRYYMSHQDVTKMEYLNNYFTFTFVRNPYEKLLSSYYYLKRTLFSSVGECKIRKSNENKEYFADFNTFVKNWKNVNNISYFHSFITQYDQLADISGNIMFNYIGKCENLDDDFLEILSIIGDNEIKHIHLVYNKIKMNKTSCKGINITDEYDEEIFLFVNDFFTRDFEILGYTKYETYGDFMNFYSNINKKKEISNTDKDITLYKNIQLLNYNYLLQDNLFQNYEKIIGFLFEGIQQYEMNNDKKNEIEKLKNETKQIFKNKNYFGIKNNELHENINKQITENNKLNQKLKRKYCEKCNHMFFNLNAHNIHILLCNK